MCVPEFGLENVGKKLLIRRELYAGKADGSNFINHLRKCMCHLNFESCPSDGVNAWVFGSTQYYRAVVENVEGYLKEKNINLPVKVDTQLQTSY